MQLTKQVALFLNDLGFGTFDETGLTGNVFIQSSPDQPHDSLAVYSNGGPEGDRNNEYGQIAIQIVIRTVPGDPRNGEALAQSVVDALSGFNSTAMVLGGNYIVDVSALQSGPNNIGKDDQGRYEYSQNFLIEYVK